MIRSILILLALSSVIAHKGYTQADSTRPPHAHKNIVRYNLSGALLFGADKYIVLGYERIISPRRSISINAGRASLPKLISIATDSFDIQKDRKRSGYNFSIDYRFYLGKENKYNAPRGVYIGPYYSFNHYEGSTEWVHKNSSANSNVISNSDFNIHTIGFELGYQFIFWKRLSLDMVLVGPGFGFYKYKAAFEGNVDAATKEQVFDGLEQLLTQKFPGMNFVFSDKEINSDGVLRTNTIGYRYLIHIGFNF